MPHDLPHRLKGGDSPPDYLPPPPPPPPPPPASPPSPPPTYAPGTSILDAGEFVPRSKTDFLEETKVEFINPDGILPNDLSATYCNRRGDFLKPFKWRRFNDQVFCVACSLEKTFPNVPVFRKRKIRDELTSDSDEEYWAEEMNDLEAADVGENTDEEMTADDEEDEDGTDFEENEQMTIFSAAEEDDDGD